MGDGLKRSELFDAVEFLWVSDGLPESLAVLDVAGVVADAGVKNVVQSMSPKEQVADDSQTFPVDLVGPQSPEVEDGVDAFLLLPHHLDETAVSDSFLSEQASHLLFVLFDEADDALAEVLGNVLCLVPHARLGQALTHQQFLSCTLHCWLQWQHCPRFRFEGFGQIEEGGRVGAAVVADFKWFWKEMLRGVLWGGRRVQALEVVVGAIAVGHLELEVVDHGAVWEELADMQMQ
jgi:hypothetical protein